MTRDLSLLEAAEALVQSGEDFAAFQKLHSDAREKTLLQVRVLQLLSGSCRHCGRTLFECATKRELPAQVTTESVAELLSSVLGKPAVVESNLASSLPSLGNSTLLAEPVKKKPKKVTVQSKGEQFQVEWGGPLDSWGNPKGKGTLVWEGTKFTGVWGTALEDSYGYPIDPPKFLSRTDSASMVPDLAEFPDGSCFQGVLGAWPNQGVLLCKGSGTLTLPTGHYTKGKWVAQGTLFRENPERIDRSLWKWAD